MPASLCLFLPWQIALGWFISQMMRHLAGSGAKPRPEALAGRGRCRHRAAMKVRVHVTLKNGVLDPQGKAIHHALEGLGFAGVNDVRAGKLIELDLADGVSDARDRGDVPQAPRQHGDRELPDRAAEEAAA